MARSRRLEDRLAALQEIREQGASDAALAELRKVLQSKTSLLVAKAARIAGQFRADSLAPELAGAFDRFLVNPVKSDPGCAAKSALVKALNEIDWHDEAVFLQGIRHVQMEPAYGGPRDTAASLRGHCALGLVRIGYPLVLNELARLLADPESDARIAAARAVAYSGGELGQALLRLKIHLGDDEPQVLGECFVALLGLAPQESLDFVAEQIRDDDPAVGELAALAMGESRRLEALPALRAAWEASRDRSLRATILLAIGVARQDDGVEFLLSLLAEESDMDARDALSALGSYRFDQNVLQRVRDAVDRRGDAELGRTLRSVFQADGD